MTPDALHAWRDRLGWKQTEAAEALGVPLRTYTRWETGKGPIERPTMLTYACNWLEAVVKGADAKG